MDGNRYLSHNPGLELGTKDSVVMLMEYPWMVTRESPQTISYLERNENTIVEPTS